MPDWEKNSRREEISFFAKGVKSSETIDNGGNFNGLENHNLEKKMKCCEFFFQPIVKVWKQKLENQVWS